MAACSDKHEEALAHALEAQAKLERNDVQGARIAIASAIAERDDVVDYHLLRGRIELAMNSQSGAFDAYNNALALDTTNPEALLAVAQLGLPTGHLRESLSAAERLLSLVPTQVEALLVRGIHSMVQRRYEEALEYSERILSVRSGDPGGTILKARATYMLGRPNEALAVLETASDSRGAAIALALTRLEIHRAMRQPDGLSDEFIRLRELQPDDPHIRVDEANFRFKRGERRQAHELLEQILVMDTLDLATANQAVELWSEYGHRDLPSSVLVRIADSGPVIARQVVARFFVNAGDIDRAELMVRALSGQAGGGLHARILMKKGRTDEGGRLANRVLGRDATNCDALIAASESASVSGLTNDALRLGQQAAAECPGQVGAWQAAARAYEQSGRGSGVARVFAQALDANQQNLALTRDYAEWLIVEKREREALAIARRFTRYAPASQSGWRLYLDLCQRFGAGCSDEARRGLANAATLFGTDLPYGTSPPSGLFGRLVEK